MKTTAENDIKGDKVCLDLQGVSCPANFVKAKMFLSKLPLGTVVEIVIDDGEPIDRVPASLTMEGYEILSEEMNTGGKTWKIVVKK